MSRTLLADLAETEWAVTATLALLSRRERRGGAGHVTVPLSEAAAFFAEPLQYGIIAPGAHLGGGLPGYNQYSSVELENALMAHDAVSQAAVIAVPHEKWDERSLDVIVLKDKNATVEKLNEHLQQSFANWWLPDAYEFVEEIL